MDAVLVVGFGATAESFGDTDMFDLVRAGMDGCWSG